MSYEKLGFQSGQLLKAEHLNYIEDGIYNLATGGSGGGELTRVPYNAVITAGNNRVFGGFYKNGVEDENNPIIVRVWGEYSDGYEGVYRIPLDWKLKIVDKTDSTDGVYSLEVFIADPIEYDITVVVYSNYEFIYTSM